MEHNATADALAALVTAAYDRRIDQLAATGDMLSVAEADELLHLIDRKWQARAAAHRLAREVDLPDSVIRAIGVPAVASAAPADQMHRH